MTTENLVRSIMMMNLIKLLFPKAWEESDRIEEELVKAHEKRMSKLRQELQKPVPDGVQTGTGREDKPSL